MTAPNPTWKVVAGEQAAICRTWVARKVALVKKSDLADTSVSAKAAGVRTTDEIAILYTNAVFYGIGTGLWIDSLTEPREAAGVILPVLAFAGGAAGVVALIDNAGAPMKYGVAQSMVTGLYLGFEEGLTWALYNQASSSRQDQWSGKTVATLVWGAATLGAVGGYVIGSVKGTTPGRASYVGSTGLWASVVSGLLGAAVSANDDRQDDHALLAAAIGLNAGIVAGLFTAGDVSPSIARVRYLDLGGIAGGLLFGGLYTAAANRGTNGQALAGTTATGIAVGLVTAWLATRNMAPDTLDAKTRARPSSSLVSSIAPSVAPTQGGAVLSLGGAF